MDNGPVPSGITFLDHTADVGVEVRARSLPELFIRAAVGMMWLLQDREGPDGTPYTPDEPGPRPGTPGSDGASSPPMESSPSTEAAPTRGVILGAAGLPSLLRAWLREILYWHEMEGVSFRDARFDALTETSLEADVVLSRELVEPVREIKGVTLHGLSAERSGDGWVGRIIFDV